LTRPRQTIGFRREILETPDGDELLLDWLDGPSSAPVLICLHGLEGSSYSVYVQGLVACAARRGWRAVALNFRSCARDPKNLNRMLSNRRPRLYHSGETQDLDFLVRSLAARFPALPLLAAGASLGGNVLLKWLGEHPAQSQVQASVALSTPFELSASARHLESGMGRFYVEPFLKTLRPKALAASRRFPEAAARIDGPGVERSRTFYEFDDAATAPLHGFSNAADYYQRSSSLGFLSRIATPTLCINASDDPFSPEHVLSEARSGASPAVEFLTPRFGGHIGFVEGAWPWRARYWAEETAIGFLSRYAV
jgi:predicted alpha/beta-fold hydrolase